MLTLDAAADQHSDVEPAGRSGPLGTHVPASLVSGTPVRGPALGRAPGSGSAEELHPGREGVGDVGAIAIVDSTPRAPVAILDREGHDLAGAGLAVAPPLFDIDVGSGVGVHLVIVVGLVDVAGYRSGEVVGEGQALGTTHPLVEMHLEADAGRFAWVQLFEPEADLPAGCIVRKRNPRPVSHPPVVVLIEGGVLGIGVGDPDRLEHLGADVLDAQLVPDPFIPTPAIVLLVNGQVGTVGVEQVGPGDLVVVVVVFGGVAPDLDDVG